MGETRVRRSLALFISIAVLLAMVTAFPCAAKKTAASEIEPSLVCYMVYKDGGDCDHIKASLTIKNAKPGDEVTVVFVMSYSDLSFSNFSEGVQFVSFNDGNLYLTLKVTGKGADPNGTYTFTIAGSNIGNLDGKSAALKSANAVNTKPGPGGEGPGGGPGGEGPGGQGPSGGPGGEGPGGGPGGEGPGGGPGVKDKPGETTVATSHPTPTPIPTNPPTPAPTSTPVPAATSTPTPIPTSAPTPVPTSVPETVPTKAPAETAATSSETASVTTTLPESTEETVPEETTETSDTSETTETIAAVAAVDPDSENTEPSGGEPSDGPSETTVAKVEEKKVVRASKTSSDYTSYILLLILALILILVYLRYSHLAKKDMSFPDICKNFIPVGAVVNKIKAGKKSKDTELDGPQPEVMNGYLQKPTVGLAAAQAIRPVRSNVAGTASRPGLQTSTRPGTQASSRPGTQVSARQGTQTGSRSGTAAKQPSDPANTPRRTPSRKPLTNAQDPALLEMERRQKIMEKEMNELFSKKEKLPGDEPPAVE